MHSNCVTGKDSWRSLGLQNQPWIFTDIFNAESETPILWAHDVKNWLTGKDPDAGIDWGEGDDRGWDGWVASLIQWTWVWANSGR